MTQDDSTVYALVNRQHIAAVNWIMEGYEHIALVSTVNSEKGIIKLICTPDTRVEALEILENLPFSLDVLEKVTEE